MTNEDRAILSDAARVYAVGRDVRAAVAELAIRPLSERAADRMRSVLSHDHEAARRSLRRLREHDVVRELDRDQARRSGAARSTYDEPESGEEESR